MSYTPNWCGGIYYMSFVYSIPFFPAVKEFWKSVGFWRSYRHQFVVHFLRHSVHAPLSPLMLSIRMQNIMIFMIEVQYIDRMLKLVISQTSTQCLLTMTDHVRCCCSWLAARWTSLSLRSRHPSKPYTRPIAWFASPLITPLSFSLPPVSWNSTIWGI